MKRGYKLIVILITLGVSSLYGCSKSNDIKKEMNKVDIKDNLVIDFKDGKEEYRYLNKGKFEEANLDIEGSLLAYNDKANISIFTNYIDAKKYLNIILEDGKLQIPLEGRLDFVYISKEGSYTLYKTCSEDNIVSYNLIDNKTKENITLAENVLISGNLIKFIDDKKLVLYGVDINKKISGLFTYDIEKGSYELINEIKGRFMSSLEVISTDKVLMIEANEESSDLYILDVKTKEMNNISSKFEYIEDAILYEDKVYISAFENDDLNLYSIDLDRDKLKRLTFDFPKSLGYKSRLLADEGKIYFSDINGIVYFYDIKEDTMNLLENQKGVYMIVDK